MISILYAVCLFWVPGHAGIRGNEIGDGLEMGGTSVRCFGPEPALEVSRRDLQRVSVAGWPTSTGPNGEVLVIRKGRLEFISGFNLGTRAKFMTFNRIQSSVVTGHLRVITP